MPTAMFARRNRIDEAILSAANQISTLPVTNLQDEDIHRVYRATGDGHFVADLIAVQPVNVFALINTNLGAGTSVRIRFSTTDATGAAGDAYDSGTFSAGVDPTRRNTLVRILSGASPGRFFRFDWTGLALDAGRAFVGNAIQFERNYAHGWGVLVKDWSRHSHSEGLSIWTDRRPRQDGIRFTLPALTFEEGLGEVLQALREQGTSKDVLFIRDPESSNLGRDSIFGMISERTGEINSRFHRRMEATFEIWARP